MSKKLITNKDGFPIAFYETDIHNNSQIPNNSIDISEHQYIELSQNTLTRKWNNFTKSVEIYDNSLELLNHILLNLELVDTLSELQHRKYITSGLGQSLVYQEKSEEAIDFLASGSPKNLAPYPFIQAEMNATNQNSTDVAKKILNAKSLWIKKGSAIEEYRIKAKIDIKNSTSIIEINSILSDTKSNIESI